MVNEHGPETKARTGLAVNNRKGEVTTSFSVIGYVEANGTLMANGSIS